MLMSTRNRARTSRIAYWRDDDDQMHGPTRHRNRSLQAERRRTKRNERQQWRNEIDT